MSHLGLIALVCHFLLSGFLKAQHNIRFSSWKNTSVYPGGKVDDVSAFTIGDSIYVGCGIDEFWNLRADWHIFDPSSDVWHLCPKLPAKPRQYASAFSFGSNGYLCAGDLGNTHYSDSCYVFDAQTGYWQGLGSAPWKPRCAAAGFKISHYYYLLGGRNLTTKFNDIWQFNAKTGLWDSLGVLPFSGRDEMVAFAYKHFGYVMLGRDTANNLFHDLWRYNSIDGQWTRMTDFPGDATIYAAGVSVLNGALIAGGEDANGNIVSTSYYYNALYDKWSKLGDLSYGDVRGMELVFHQKSGYTFGGITHNFTRIDAVQKIDLNISDLNRSENALVLSPNPASDRLYVSSKNPLKAIPNINIYNVSGQLVLKEVLIESSTTVEVNINALLPGLYILVVEDKDELYRSPLVISKN